jgi:uncharacterized protein YkwD
VTRAALAAVAALASCGAPADVAPAEPEASPIAEPLAPPLVLAPHAPAATYGEPPPAREPDAIADGVFAAIARAKTGYGVIARDPRLDYAAAELADVVRRGGSLDRGVVEFALHARGVVEPAAAFAAAGDAAALQAALGSALDHGNVRLGVGGAAPTVAIVVYTLPLALGAIPRGLAVGGSFELTGTFADGHRDARISVTHDDGTVDHPDAAPGPAVHATIACTSKGLQWLAVEAATDAGPLVLLPIACGDPPPATFAIEPDANLATTDPERRLASIINRERTAVGLAPLRPDARATAAARRYAETMRRAASAAHDLDGQPADRVRAAGLVPPLLLESTMQVDSLGRAAELLLDDAKYRGDLVSPQVTHAGIGIAADAHGELYVAIDYVAIPKAVDLSALADRVRDAIRASQTFPKHLIVQQEIATAAQRYATGLANGDADAELWRRALEELRDLDRRYSMWNHTAAPLDVDHLDGKALVAAQEVDAIGIGLAQAPPASPQAGTVWVVVIFAQR